MKVVLCLLILAIVVSRVLANIESCKETTDCSEAMRNKCIELSNKLEGGQISVLACKNGICMCNIQFFEHRQPEFNKSCYKEDVTTENDKVPELLAETTTANAENS